MKEIQIQSTLETGQSFIARHQLFHDMGVFSSSLPSEIGDTLFAKELAHYAENINEMDFWNGSLPIAKKIGGTGLHGWIVANLDVMRQDAVDRARMMGLELISNAMCSYQISPNYRVNDSPHTDGPTNFPLFFYLAVVGADTQYYEGDFLERLPSFPDRPKLKEQVGKPVKLGSGKILRGDFSTVHEVPNKDDQGNPRTVIRLKALVKS